MASIRCSEDSNLLRSHYYFLEQAYSDDCVQLLFNNKHIYLHKDYRGFAYNPFTHNDFVSLIRVFMLDYLGIKYININDILRCFDDYSDEYEYENGKRRPETACDYKTFDFVLDKKECCEFFGTPVIEAKSAPPNHLNMLHFCDYIDRQFGNRVAHLLTNPIWAVFHETDIFCYAYKAHKNLKQFCVAVLPSIHDYKIAFSINEYCNTFHQQPNEVKKPLELSRVRL